MVHRRQRRGIGRTASDPTFDAKGPLIVRWIGAAARKRGRAADREAPPAPTPDNVTRLSWADTFGRAISADPQRPEGPATVLAMRPRASRRACGPIVRTRQAVSAAIPTSLP